MKEIGEVLGRQLAADLRRFPTWAKRRYSTGGRAARCVNISELRQQACRATPRAIFDFVDGAANDEITARRNEMDLQELELSPRILAGAAEVWATLSMNQ